MAATSAATKNISSNTLPSSNITTNNGRTYAASTFSELYESLLSQCRTNPPLLPPVAAFAKTTPRTLRVPNLGNETANLSLHPTLEAALHILNLDLPSAHFLLRHMQCAPAWESMFLHGILHRIEGDYNNARAWYGDVKDSEVFAYAWGRTSDSSSTSEVPKSGIDAALAFIAETQSLKETGRGDGDELGSRSLDEIQAVVAFCAKRFGVQRVEDAREIWTKSEGKIKEKAQAMVVGGEGWREF
jgi:hypothetical protein